MKPDVAMQGRGLRGTEINVGRFARWILPVAIFFAIAFTIDMLTGQRYSSVWGSAAIIASALNLFPAIRPAVAAVGGYASVWIGFNIVRAFADDAGLGIASTTAVSAWEQSLFNGGLPSAALQSWWFDRESIGLHDMLLALVHGSFFIVPTAVALLVWWKHRSLFKPYAFATGATFILGLIGFLFLPTALPWMSDPGEVTRITHVIATDTLGLSIGDSSATATNAGFGFEPNHLAAMPSVHVSATVLLFLLLTHIGTLPAVLGGAYAFLMTLSVVYLGEHFVIDAVFGWVIALLGWRFVRRWLPTHHAPTRRSGSLP